MTINYTLSFAFEVLSTFQCYSHIVVKQKYLKFKPFCTPYGIGFLVAINKNVDSLLKLDDSQHSFFQIILLCGQLFMIFSLLINSKVIMLISHF